MPSGRSLCHAKPITRGGSPSIRFEYFSSFGPRSVVITVASAASPPVPASDCQPMSLPTSRRWRRPKTATSRCAGGEALPQRQVRAVSKPFETWIDEQLQEHSAADLINMLRDQLSEEMIIQIAAKGRQ